MLNKAYKYVAGTAILLLIPGSIVVVTALILYNGYKRDKEDKKNEQEETKP